MSGRAHRRLLKQRQETLSSTNADLSESSDTDTEPNTTAVNPFALLMDQDENESHSSSTDERISESDNSENSSNLQKPLNPGKKMKKRGIAGRTLTGDVNSMSMEDLTRALAEVEHLHHIEDQVSDIPVPHVNTLLIDVKHLNMDAELARIFGQNVVRQAEHVVEHRPRNGRRNLQPRTPRKSLRKSILAGNPDDQWPMWTPMGLLATRARVPKWAITAPSSATSPSLEVDVIILRHSPTYQKIHESYLEALSTGDPFILQQIHQANPWHPDTLLRLASIAYMSGQADQGKNFVKRALFAIDKSLALSFAPLVPHVPYVVPSNRVVHLVLLAHLSELVRMPGGRTVLEISKLMLGLDPTDPLAMRDVVPGLAIRAHEPAWVLEWLNEQQDGLIHMQYTRALATWKLGRGNEAQQVLTDAVHANVAVARILVPSLKVRVLNRTLSIPGSFDTMQEESDVPASTYLYWHYAQQAWSDPTVLAWLSSIPIIQVDNNSRKSTVGPDSVNVYRHIVAAEISSLMYLIPNDLRDAVSVIDPIPPNIPANTDLYYTNPYANFVPRGILGRNGPVSLAEMSVGEVMHLLRRVPGDLANEIMNVLGMTERDER